MQPIKYLTNRYFSLKFDIKPSRSESTYKLFWHSRKSTQNVGNLANKKCQPFKLLSQENNFARNDIRNMCVCVCVTEGGGMPVK